MRCFPLCSGVLLSLVGAASTEAQTSDTLPARVVDRMFDAFNRGDQITRSTLYDSVYYFQDLQVPPLGNPARPAAMSARERARAWQANITEARFDTLPRRSRKVLQRMVVGRFVVYHIAVLFEPPHEDHSFEKLEVYEVKNGKIVAEYDGQFIASGRPKRQVDPRFRGRAPLNPRKQPTGRSGASRRWGGTSRERSWERRFVRVSG